MLLNEAHTKFKWLKKTKQNTDLEFFNSAQYCHTYNNRMNNNNNNNWQNFSFCMFIAQPPPPILRIFPPKTKRELEPPACTTQTIKQWETKVRSGLQCCNINTGARNHSAWKRSPSQTTTLSAASILAGRQPVLAFLLRERPHLYNGRKLQCLSPLYLCQWEKPAAFDTCLYLCHRNYHEAPPQTHTCAVSVTASTSGVLENQ